MIVTELRRLENNVIIIVRDREHLQPIFDLRTIPNPDHLIALIKAKFSEIEQPPHTPPTDPYAEKFALLKTALEGQDIGD